MTPRRVAALASAVAAGGVLWSAHPPVGWGWLAYAVVPLLLFGLDLADDGPAAGAALGAVAGMVGFLGMLGWLIAPAGMLGWLLLAAVQAAWYAVTLAVIAPFRRSNWLVAVAPVVWTAMEVWRGLIPLSGFAWGALAYTHADGSVLLDLARVVGGPGVTFLTVLVGTVAYVTLRHVLEAEGPSRARWTAVGAGATVALFAGGALAPDPPEATGRTVDVLAVQGNDIERPSVPGRELDRLIGGRMVDLTRRSVEEDGRPDLTVWPESSIDRDPWSRTGEDLLPFVLEAADVTGGQLLFGANLDGPRPKETFLNSVNLVDGEGELLDRYVKRRYVPFGEYVPLRSVLEPLVPALRQVPRDGVAGPGAQAIDADEVSVAVVICFETLFPDVVRSNVLAGDAGLVVAVTNDAAFGRSSESDQHIAQSQLRAVETGRWVLHAALSGRSALIDPSGRVVERTDVFERAIIRHDVPVVTAPTDFLRAGDLVGTGARWASVALVTGLLSVAWWRRRTEEAR